MDATNSRSRWTSRRVRPGRVGASCRRFDLDRTSAFGTCTRQSTTNSTKVQPAKRPYSRADMTDLILVLTTAPEDEAEMLARTLVEEHLAACVNVQAPMTSVYWWKGKIERDAESQIVIKTTRARLDALAARLAELHSYELPELLVVPVLWGTEGYLAWVKSSTNP